MGMQTDGYTDGLTYRQMNRHKYIQIDIKTEGHRGRWTHRQMNAQTDREIYV
jgi:hypothetical protein